MLMMAESSGPISATAIRPNTIVVIDERHLVAECLARCLKSKRPADHVAAFPSVIDWIASLDFADEEAIVVLSIGSRRADDPHVTEALQQANDASPRSAVVLVADGDDASQILGALDHGARGYIPTNVTLDVAVNAMLVVGVGGTFVPASSLTSSRQLIRTDPAPSPAFTGMFTARQAAVVEALRKGKANKIIAYELNMRESTVKVHVRNIMKRLKARNRTEVAFIANTQMDRLEMDALAAEDSRPLSA